MQSEKISNSQIIEEFVGLLLNEGREKEASQFIKQILENKTKLISKKLKNEFLQWHTFETYDEEPFHLSFLNKEDVPLDLVLWHSDYLEQNGKSKEALCSAKNLLEGFKADVHKHNGRKYGEKQPPNGKLQKFYVKGKI